MFLKVTKWNPKLNVKDRFQNFILQTYCLVWQSYWAKAATKKHSPRSGRRNRPSKGRTIMIVCVYQFQEFIKVWNLHIYYCVSSENLWTRIQGKMVLSCSRVSCSTVNNKDKINLILVTFLLLQITLFLWKLQITLFLWKNATSPMKRILFKNYRLAHLKLFLIFWFILLPYYG